MFKTKVTLQNDSIYTGYIFSHCIDGDLDTFSINGLVANKYIPYYFDSNRDTLRLYRNVIRLKYPDNYNIRTITCHSNDVIKISLDDIKSIEQIEKSSCHPELDNSTMYASSGEYPFVIEELNEEEIKKLETKPVLSFYTEKCMCWDLAVFWIISYNEELTRVDIESLLEKEFCKFLIEGSTWEIDYGNCQQAYSQIKKKFAEKQIIIYRAKYLN